MIRAWRVAATFLLAAALIACRVGVNPAMAQTLAVTGATVIDPLADAPLSDGVVLIEDGRITAVGPVGAVDVPAGMPVIDARFREHTLGFFERHGVEVVGFWHEVVGRSDRLVYLTRFADMADRERKWGSFISDPEWLQLRADTEADGQIVARIHNRFLEPTDYSPLP